MQEQITFDREKLKDAVHYVIDYVGSIHSANRLGNLRLHKILYYADMIKYRETGEPITGAPYQRNHHGPTAKHLTAVVAELRNEGRISVSEGGVHGLPMKIYESLRPAKPMANYETALLKHFADWACDQSTTEVSEYSHDDVWESVPMFAEIPYYASFALFRGNMTEEDLEDARAEIDDIPAERIEEYRRACGI